MQICVFDNEQKAAEFAATRLAYAAGSAVAERGAFSLALSGGNSPWPMLARFAAEEAPWDRIQIFQADERVVPMDSAKRTFAKLQSVLLSKAPIPKQNVHPMPVEADDLAAAAKIYEATLASFLGSPPVLDCVHLGLGADGHTASLTPGDADLCAASDVAISGVYEGSRRMTLTYSMLNRSREILWLVLGEDKAAMARRLVAGDASIPAGRIEAARAIIVADKAAARLLGTTG